MEDLRGYVLSIAAAAISCSLVQSFFSAKSAYGAVIKLLCSFAMAIVLISPWTKLSIDEIIPFMGSYSADAAAVIDQGVSASEESTRALIKERTQAYILDKAVNMGLDLEIQVDLSGESPPVPQRIFLTGDCSPLDREKLTACLMDDFGLEKEKLVWK